MKVQEPSRSLHTKGHTVFYQNEVAKRKLAHAVGNEKTHLADRRVAGIQLLKQFKELAEEYHLGAKSTGDTSHPDPSEKDKSVTIILNKIEIEFEISGNAWISASCVSAAGAVLKGVLPLVFNPASKLFEGTEIESEITPEPGRPVPRKSALTVLVEEALKLAAAAST